MEQLLHNPNFLSGLSALGAMAVVILIWGALIENDPLPTRLKNVADRRSELRTQEQQKKLSRHAGVGQTDVIKQIVKTLRLAQGKKIDELRMKLARAGYRTRDALFMYLFSKLVVPPCMAGFAFFFVFVLHAVKVKPIMGVMIVIFGALFGFMLPDILIKNKSQKREHVLRKFMPDALDLLVICAEAGLSLDVALERVSREIGPSCPELAEEIGLTAVELSFFPERAKALQNMASRVPLPGVIALANTLVQTEKYGTPLAQALRVLSSEMREERIMAAEAKAAKLPATLTVPMILFILPPLFVILIGPAVIKVLHLTGSH
jgi:tight adherence protein C